MYLDVQGQQAYAYTGGVAFNPARPTVVFVHGAGLDHSVWLLQARYLAHNGYGVLAVDLPGHGRSAGAALASIGALADWLAAFLDAAGVDCAAIVGHSMGAAVAIEFAARVPERASGIAVVGASLPMPVAPPLLAAARADEHAAYDMIALWAHAYAAQVGGNTIPGIWMVGATVRLLERNRPGALGADFTACNDYADGLDSARKVVCPALLVLGGVDLMTPARAVRDVVAALKDVRTITLAGAGHMLMQERPDAVLDALRDFLRPLAAAA